MHEDSRPAPLWRRLAALLYDLFPLGALWMLTAALGLFAVHGEIDPAHPPPLYRHGLQAALLVVSAGYFLASWRLGGQTIGMRAWRIRLIGEDGTPTRAQLLLRFTVALLSLAALGVGFLWCLLDAERRAWHDLAARTKVVRLGR